MSIQENDIDIDLISESYSKINSELMNEHSQIISELDDLFTVFT